MFIEKIIVDAVTLSKATKIPVLFMSNPGLGKTTILNRYAKNNNMHLETLIGSRFSPEEISGYMVNNGGTYLQHMNPEWFERIHQKNREGIPTLLFIDELSTCSEAVQGSLLSLIFDRSIGSQKFLPDNCLIVSAANYYGNLDGSMNIIAPTINRFAIINLSQNYTALDLVDEFLNENRDFRVNYLPQKMSEDEELKFSTRFNDFWKNTFNWFSDSESSNGVLDISNQNIGSLYQNDDGAVYNFISGRTLSYFKQFTKAYLEYGMDNPELYNMIVDGLVGGGTCSFKDEKQGEHYRRYLYGGMKNIMFRDAVVEKREMKFTGDISKDISAFMIFKEGSNIYEISYINEIKKLCKEIVDYFAVTNVMTNTMNENGQAKFITDFESLLELLPHLSIIHEVKDQYHEILKPAQEWYGIYCDMLDIEPNFTEQFGIADCLFDRACLGRTSKDNQPTKYEAYAIRHNENTKYPTLFRIEQSKTLAETGLVKPLRNAKETSVLVWANKKFKLIGTDFYRNNYMLPKC